MEAIIQEKKEKLELKEKELTKKILSKWKNLNL
jgi:hypothetical protein